MESQTSPLFDRLNRDTDNLSPASRLADMGYTSVFDIVRHPKAEFAVALREGGAGDWNAEEIYDNAVSYAIQLYRSFLEHELHGDPGTPAPTLSGVRGLVEQRPDYPTLFKENWDAFCRAGAFESRYGPAAYLCELYRVATEVFESAALRDASKRIRLAQRRPDLAQLIVEPGAINEPAPMLNLVNEILEAAIEDFRHREDPDDPRPLYQVFAERSHPLNFPYHQPHHKIQLVLDRRHLTLGGLQLLAQPLDSILFAGDRVAMAATALRFCSVLSPPQQNVLMSPENPNRFFPTADQLAYLHHTTGSGRLPESNGPTEPIDSLLSPLGITTEELDQLLARGDYAPKVTPHLVPTEDRWEAHGDELSAPYEYGAAYVHGGLPQAMEIENGSSESDKPRWQLNHLSASRRDQLQRMVRLQRWIGISYEELDMLVAAVSRAESTSSGIMRLMTSNVMRIIGALRYFNEQYGIATGDFAALFDDLAVHGLGGRPSLFDRWFNPPSLSQQPFVLDNSELPVSLEEEGIEDSQRAAVRRLCAVLGMLPTDTSYGLVAEAVKTALDSDPAATLYVSREVVSAFFRVCRAARMFGLDVVQLLALLDLLGGKSYQVLAVSPKLRTYSEPDRTDTLDVWLQVSAVVDWLAENHWTVATLMHLLHRDGGRLAADNGLLQFVRAVATNLGSALVSPATMVHPDLPYDTDWLALLREVEVDGNPLVDASGLIATFELMPPAAQVAALKQLLEQLDSPDIPTEEPERQKVISALAERVLALSHAQDRALAIAMNQAMAVPDDVASLVVRWAGNSDAMDKWTTAVFLAETLALATVGEYEGIPAVYLKKVYDLRRHALAREATALSSQAFYTLLAHPDRFGLADGRLSIDVLYLLTRYGEWLRESGVQEDLLLAYMAVSGPHDTDLLASLLGWEADELVHAIDAATQARTWRCLNTLLCRKAAGEEAGLPAATLASFSALDPEDDWPTWSAAGDAALAAALS